MNINGNNIFFTLLSDFLPVLILSFHELKISSQAASEQHEKDILSTCWQKKSIYEGENHEINFFSSFLISITKLSFK